MKLRAQTGFNLVEAILSIATFALLLTFLGLAFLYGPAGAVIDGNRVQATLLAEEGLEVVRNIRDAGWSNVLSGTYGLVTSSNQWVLSGASDSRDIFTRQIVISDIDANRKSVTANVSWQQNGQRRGFVSLATHLTNWQKSKGSGGILVYGSGTMATDTIAYRILDPVNQTWSAPASVSDIDPSTTNRVLRAARVYASASRNEKILISRHYNGKTQYVYSQVFNGTSWGSTKLLASWNSSNYLDVQNFDGTYLSNGDFMVVYADNTNTPKFRVWNGTTWSASSLAMRGVGAVPVYIVAKARPNTKEVMAVFFTTAKNTRSQYFNGATYVTANWTLHSSHASQAPKATNRLIDFVWSVSNPLVGGMVFCNSNNDRSMDIKIWTASGSGSGTWSAIATGPNQGSSATRVVTVDIAARSDANEFVACSKNTSSQIVCYLASFTPAWSTPANSIISPVTDNGIQRSYDFGYEGVASNGLISYSDFSVVPKLKKYNPSAKTFDAVSTNINELTASLATTRVIPNPLTSDVIILLADNARSLSSIVWDGASDAFYSSPSGLNFTSHGASGSAAIGYWYDFAWDQL